MLISMVPQLLDQMNHFLGGGSGTGDLDDLPEPMRSYYLRHQELLREDQDQTAATLTLGAYKQADYDGVEALEERHLELVATVKEILKKRDVEGYITDPNEIDQIVEQSFHQECATMTDEELETFIRNNESSDLLNQEMQQKRLAGVDITKDPRYMEYVSSQGMVEPTLISTEGLTSAATGRIFGSLGSVESPQEFRGLQDGYFSENVETDGKVQHINDAEFEQLDTQTENSSHSIAEFDSKYATLIDSKVTVIEKAELPSWIEESYTDGYFRTVVTNEEITVYRSFGGNARAGGAFVSTLPAANRIQSKIDAALLPIWKNTREDEAVMVIPKGTVLNIGKVAPQFTDSGARLEGGVDQILLPQNWPEEWIKEIRKIPSR